MYVWMMMFATMLLWGTVASVSRRGSRQEAPGAAERSKHLGSHMS